MSVLPACVQEHHTCAVLRRSEEGIAHYGIGVTDDCGSPYRCLELDPGPLQE